MLSKIMLNSITLISLNTIFLLSNIYPKHILEVGSIQSIIASVFNFIFYILIGFFVVIVFNKNKHPFSDNLFSPLEKVSQRLKLKKICTIIILQLISDIIVLSISSILVNNRIYLIDFMTLIQWICFYNICVNKENNIFLKKTVLAVSLWLIILFTITTYFNAEILKCYEATFQKYDYSSKYLLTTIKNLDFMFGVKNFIFDTCVGLGLIVTHILSNKNLYNKEKAKITLNIIRLFIIFFLTLIIIFSKTLIMPFSCIKSLQTDVSDSKNTTLENDFFAKTTTITISRVDSLSTTNNVFQYTENELLFNGDTIFKYISNDNIRASMYEKNGNQIIINDCFEKIRGDDFDFFIYKNQVICFVEEGVPIIINGNNNLNNYSKRLVEVYKKLIEIENFEFFDISSKYLFEYDKSFIEPYLQRYSMGNFNESEIENMKNLGIKTSYIESISTQLHQK